MKRSLGTLVGLILTTAIGQAHAGVDWTRHAQDAAGSSGLESQSAQGVIALTRVAVSRAAPGGYRAAAASMAAFVVLECFFPERRLGLEIALAADLADYPETDQKASALQHGRREGEELIRSSGRTCGAFVEGY